MLVLVDPNAISDRSMGMMGGMSSSPDEGFKKLMDKWGIEVQANAFAGDKYLSGVGTFAPGQAGGRLLPLLNCNELCTRDYNEPMSSGIDNATFIFPGVLTNKQIEGVVHTPIMATTEKGNSYTAAPYELNNPGALWDKFTEGSKPVVIAYKALGKYQTAFPNGIKTEKAKGANKASPAVVKTSEKESAIIVVSDVDFINDRFSFKNTFLGPAMANNNSTLFLNGVEALSGNVDLMRVRSKGKINRSFDVVNAIELESERRTADKVKQIQAGIQRFQNELTQLGRQANEGNIALLQNEGIRKKKELAKKIAVLKRELRMVKREGREKIEGMGKFFQYLNTLLVPLLIVGLGVYYNRRRSKLMEVRA